MIQANMRIDLIKRMKFYGNKPLQMLDNLRVYGLKMFITNVVRKYINPGDSKKIISG